MNSINEVYNREATAKFMQVSQRTAALYRNKKAAQHRRMNDF